MKDIKKYKIGVSFVLPLTNGHDAITIENEVKRRVGQIIGQDVFIDASHKVLYRAWGKRNKGTNAAKSEPK